MHQNGFFDIHHLVRVVFAPCSHFSTSIKGLLINTLIKKPVRGGPSDGDQTFVLFVVRSECT